MSLAARSRSTGWEGEGGEQTLRARPDGAFNGVSCTSPSNCFAVGFYDVSGNEHALAEFWNGVAWTIVNLPGIAGNTYSVLNGITCTGSSCVALGNYGDPSDDQQAMAEELSAGSWTVSAIPLPAGGSHPSLNAVSCPAASGCIAVGEYSNGSKDVPLAEKWNGATWASQAVPAPFGQRDQRARQHLLPLGEFLCRRWQLVRQRLGQLHPRRRPQRENLGHPGHPGHRQREQRVPGRVLPLGDLGHGRRRPQRPHAEPPRGGVFVTGGTRTSPGPPGNDAWGPGSAADWWALGDPATVSAACVISPPR